MTDWLALPDSGLRASVLLILAAFFVFAGVMHFVKPRMFAAIVPPNLPRPLLLVAVSGAAEIAGGLGLLLPQTRIAAGIGLILLLLAVFPANIHMARDASRFKQIAPAWALWARLPLQPVLMGVVAWASRIVG